MRNLPQHSSPIAFPVSLQPSTSVDEHVETEREPWGWLEAFVLIQVVWGVLLFVPGSQAYRTYIRAFPYVASLAALANCLRTGSIDGLGPGARWVLLSLFLLVTSLMHPDSWLMSGTAQIVFQLSIAAPLFWAVRTWITRERLERVMWLVFAANFAGAAVGLLQVYYPERFMPPEFSTLGMRLNSEWVESLSYVGASQRVIIRPPGLSDLPGGAAIAGVIAALLGFSCAVRAGTPAVTRLAYLGAVLLAITVVYLTQVRSMLLMLVICMQVMAFVALRQGRAFRSGWIVTLGVVLVVGSFVWAVTLGGDALRERFQGIVDSGVMQTYQSNRGFFLEQTIRELVPQYPFGAGLGRWGMMTVYFGDANDWRFSALHAEIQATGWLYDGGILLWLAYGGALIVALYNTYRVAIDADGPLHDLAGMVLSVQVLIVGLCFTGPAFNTQLGILFWLLTAILHAAQRTVLAQYLIESESEDADSHE